MSTGSKYLHAALLAFMLAWPGATGAQSSQPAEQEAGSADFVGPLLERAKEAYTLPEPEPEKPADCEISEDETLIIVCAPVEADAERYRVSSRLEEGDDSHLSWAGEAPDVAGPGIFRGPATVGGLCVVPPCPPPPVYMIDVTALPEAPPGSDADRIARGLAPRGSRYDEGEALVEAEAIAGSAADRSDTGPATDTADEEGIAPQP